jgi:hypothetical protein
MVFMAAYTNRKIIWITRTAVFIALLIGAQFVTRPLGQLVTGSLVNLILIVSGMTCGLASGLFVSVVSPVFATLLGIGPQFWPLAPFQMAGNAVIVTAWYLLGGKNVNFARYAAALPVAAVSKFLVLYLGIVKIAIPYFFDLPQPQAERFSAIFSFPQLITAAIGGGLAIAALPLLKKILALKT